MHRKSIKFAREFLILTFSILTVATAWAQKPLGCDIASFQSGISWTQVTNSGVVFCWAKATQATDYVNPYFTAQEAAGTSHHVYMGAYHYAQPSTDPNITGANSADTEAAYFWKTAGNYIKYGGKYMVPMLDWEDTGVANNSSFTQSQMSQWVNEWCYWVSNSMASNGIVGVRPVVYTGTWYSKPSSSYPGLNTTVTNWPNWMSDYNGESAQSGSPVNFTYPWPSWQIWQYDDTNTAVANWTGGDVDVYNGTLAGFVQTFVIGGTNAPNITTNVASRVVELGTNVTLSVAVSGQSINFQWQFNGTNIIGATSSNYTIANVQLTNAGAYTVVVSNSYANFAGNQAYLWVVPTLTNAVGSVLAPTNIVNWWTADQTLVDMYGTNHLAAFNGVSYANGEDGMAFHFNGSTSYLLPAGGATNIPPNWTLCLWVNRQNAPGTSAALMGDSTYALKLEQYNGTREIGLTESQVADYYFKIGVPQNQWTHVALVDSGSQLSLYTNGVFASSTLYSNSVAIVTPSGIPLPRACIGADELNGSQTDFMLGSMDEILTFHRALTAAQIAAIYAAGSAGFVRAPQFTGVSANASGQVQLNLQGLTGKSITLFGSTDLINWTSLGAIANPTGAVQYVNSPVAPQMFYRAAQPLP